MPHQTYFRSVATAVAFVLVIALVATMSAVSADGDDDVAISVQKSEQQYPNLGSQLNQMVSNVQEGRMSASDAAGGGAIFSDESVAVTIHLSGHVDEVVAFLEEFGGDPRNVGEDYIEAYVPLSLLGSVSEQPGVLRVRQIIPPQPTQLSQQVIGNGPVVHGSPAWNEAGYGGEGIKVGIIDDFKDIDSLFGIELPSSVVARCYTDLGVYSSNLSDCLDFEPVDTSFPQCQEAIQARSDVIRQHGTWVAEAVVDLAPDVTLYIANPGSKAETQETADWMASQGVSVINLSAGWTFDGPGDGTSPLSVSPLNTVDQVVASDVLWVNSAGNAAEDSWFDSFYDPDGDGAHGFNANNDEVLNLGLRECSRNTYQLRWEDSWTAAGTDLDLHLYHIPTRSIVFSGDDVQAGNAGDVPWEALGFEFSVDSTNYGLVVTHASGPVPDWIQITAWTSGSIEHHTLSSSITNPAESANPGLLAVGAAPWFDVNTIEFFSSRGPAPDGRPKPDIVGADCGESALLPLEFSSRLGGDCGFSGTSQAAPHVAGMAALVRQRFPDLSAEQTAAYLKNTAEPRGAVPNNTWGYGFAQLPASEVGDCVHELTTDGATGGQWSPQCQSLASQRGYSQFYSFTLEETTQVTIELTSTVDPYLFLRAGEARSGGFLHGNDDIEAGANTNSRITSTLPAGAYTIEATTYDAAKTGPFNLTITGLGGDGSGETETTPDGCGQTISADGTTPGTWASGCDSETPALGSGSGDRLARYYTFTLSEQSAVTIELESSEADTYLYLRAGEARSGAFLEQDDDTPDTNRSEIVRTLAAGSYTIEATTYDADETGAFTLTISGLSGATTDPDPDPETDICAATAITAADSPVTAAWITDCRSTVSGRGYARYYTFTLDQPSAVTIDLQSTVDPYLFLRSGTATSGATEAFNDDVEPGVNLNSQISQTLGAGSYTIEATTYDADETGAFTLTVSGLSGATTGPDPDPDPETDTCAATAITAANSPVTGAWITDCRSTVSGRGYARYYTFTLDQQSAVTIDLQSTVDPYLFLRSGTATSGATEASNDDVEPGVNLNSQISQSLAAATYTIEAATYDADETGSFTLTISGLSGDGGGGEPETDACLDTLAVDGTTNGTWAAGCDSQTPAPGSGSGPRLARYYSFTLDQPSDVTIDLESDLDTFLYLRTGNARAGAVLHENDDVDRPGGDYDSRISETLMAGTYTIEATTYHADQAGTFTLAISGLPSGP